MFNRQKVFRWALLILSGLACLMVLAPFTVEILSAAFFAFALFPLAQSLSGSKYFHHRHWVAVTLGGFILAVSAPVILLGVSFFRLFDELTSEGFQKSALYQDLSNGKDVLLHLVNSASRRFGLSGQMDLPAFINHTLSGMGAKIMSVSTDIVSRLPEYGLSLFIFCCALYLFLAEGRRIRILLMHNRLVPPHELDRLIPLLQQSCYTTLIASLVVGGIQAGIVTLGAAILGSQNVLIVFLATFISSFIPVIGAAPIAFLLAFLALIKGQTAFALGYVIVATIAGTADNVIRPILVRGKENVHPVVMLLAIIGAILIFGIPGVFLGPMFISAAVEIYTLYVFGEPLEVKVEAPPEELPEQP